MVDGEMGRAEGAHRSPVSSSSHNNVQQDSIDPQLPHTPQTSHHHHAHAMQLESQAPSHNPQAILLHSVQPVQFPPQPGHGNQSHTTHSPGQHFQPNSVMPQRQQTNNVAYHGHLPPYYPFQPYPSPAAMQYVPVHQAQTTMVVPLQQTAPVVMVPPQPRVMTVGTEAWTTGLLDCMDDPSNGLIFIWEFKMVVGLLLDKFSFFFLS